MFIVFIELFFPISCLPNKGIGRPNELIINYLKYHMQIWMVDHPDKLKYL